MNKRWLLIESWARKVKLPHASTTLVRFTIPGANTTRLSSIMNKRWLLPRSLGKEGDIAMDLNNIGSVYYSWGQYDKAIKHFEASIELKEKLRKTATGDVRRDYLASQIHTYQFLISSYLGNNDPSNAFETIELSRAKLLAERLAKSDLEIIIPTVNQVQKTLPEDTAIITYANFDLSIPVTLIAITKNNVFGTEISDDEFITAVNDRHETQIKSMIASKNFIDKTRAITIKTTEKKKKSILKT